MSAEDRANPSKGTFADPDYLAHAKANLDANSYRMLHLNLPSSPPGAAYSADAVARCVLTGTRSLPREHGVREYAAYDGSGGSYADAVLAISRFDVASGKGVVVLCERQTGDAPFSPRMAIKKFAGICRDRGIGRVSMDHYAGQMQRQEWEEEGIGCDVVRLSAHDLYERLEPMINNGTVAFCDSPRLVSQLYDIGWQNGKIGPRRSDMHDDHANAAALALFICAPPPRPEEMTATAPVIVPIDPISAALQSTAGGGYWRVDDRDW
jgi:hypothetical protein